MKMKTMLLLFILIPVGLRAQSNGLMFKDGEWQKPTPAAALRAFEADPNGADDSDKPILAVLRQRYQAFTDEELNALAENLVVMIREGTPEQADNAFDVLLFSGRRQFAPSEDTPYAGAKDIFIRLYESGLDRRSEGKGFSITWKSALQGVYSAGGYDYVRNLFGASELPPPCQYQLRRPVENPCPNKGTWCDAGLILLSNEDEHAPDSELWRRRCGQPRIGF